MTVPNITSDKQAEPLIFDKKNTYETKKHNRRKNRIFTTYTEHRTYLWKCKQYNGNYKNNKGPMINTIERFYILRAIKDGLYLNDTHTKSNNAIFDTLINYQNKNKTYNTSPHPTNHHPHPPFPTQYLGDTLFTTTVLFQPVSRSQVQVHLTPVHTPHIPTSKYTILVIRVIYSKKSIPLYMSLSYFQLFPNSTLHILSSSFITQ
jgi:hypothetical protein